MHKMFWPCECVSPHFLLHFQLTRSSEVQERDTQPDSLSWIFEKVVRSSVDKIKRASSTWASGQGHIFLFFSLHIQRVDSGMIYGAVQRILSASYPLNNMKMLNVKRSSRCSWPSWIGMSFPCSFFFTRERKKDLKARVSLLSSYPFLSFFTLLTWREREGEKEGRKT